MKMTPLLLFLIFLIICPLQGFNSEKTVTVTRFGKGLELTIQTETKHELGEVKNSARCWKSLKPFEYFGSPKITTKRGNEDKSSIFELQSIAYFKCLDISVGVPFMKVELNYATIPNNREAIKTVTVNPQIIKWEVQRFFCRVNVFKFTYVTYRYFNYKEPTRYLGIIEDLDRTKDEKKCCQGKLEPKLTKLKNTNEEILTALFADSLGLGYSCFVSS